MRRSFWTAAALTFAALATEAAEVKTHVSTAATPTAVAAPALPGGRAAIGDFGVDLSAGKKSVKAGDDFFAYANGTWEDTFEIPADKASFGEFERLDDLSKQRVRTLIEAAGAAHAPKGTPQQQIGDYYTAFMDEAAIEADGLKAIEPQLAAIGTLKSRADVARLFGTIGYASLFDVQLPADFKNPDRYAVFISEATLGLPDRDYYLKDDPQLKAVREKYVAYIEQLLTLANASADAHADARAIMAFETEASKVQWPVEQRRDYSAIYNPRTKKQLEAYAPGFPWQSFLEAQQLGAREDLVLAELTAIRDMAALFGRTSVPTLKAFLTFHYLSDSAAYLPKRFDEARFDFYGRVLRGQPQQRARWKRGVDAVDDALGEAVGKLYVAQYFPPESKAKMQKLVANLLAALSERIDALDWMSPRPRRARTRSSPRSPRRSATRTRGATTRRSRCAPMTRSATRAAPPSGRVELPDRAPRQAGRPRRMGHDAADGQRLLQPVQQRDRLPGGHPAAAVLRSERRRRGELRRHRRGDRSRDRPRLRRPGPQVRPRRRHAGLVDGQGRRGVHRAHGAAHQAVQLLRARSRA